MDSNELRDYLSRCGDVLFKDPRRGLEMAQRGPEMARQIGDHELEAMALAVLAGAHRTLSDYETAEHFYGEALELRTHCSQLTLADIQRRLAALRFYQCRIHEGIDLASSAEEIFRQAEEPNQQAAACVMRGILYHYGSINGHAEWLPPAVQDFAQALRLVDPEAAPRAALGALHGFAVAIADAPTVPEDLVNVLRAVECFHLAPGTVPAAKVLWVRGLIVARFGATRQAARHLTQARDDLARLGLPTETALVSLDLGALHLEHHEWTELAEVSSHAVMLFLDSLPAEILAALTLWRTAALNQRLTEDLNQRIRRTIATGDPGFLRADAGLLADQAEHHLTEKRHLTTPVSRTFPAPAASRRLAGASSSPTARSVARPPAIGQPRRIQIRLAPLDASSLDLLAERRKLSRAEIVRRLLRAAIGENPRGAELARQAFGPRIRPRRTIAHRTASRNTPRRWQLHLEPTDVQALDTLAECHQQSRAEVVRTLLRDAADRELGEAQS